MTPPIPPARAAHLFAHEQGETQQDAQRSFLRSLDSAQLPLAARYLTPERRSLVEVLPAAKGAKQ